MSLERFPKFQLRTQLLRLALQSLQLHKLRSLLTISGVVFGVGSVIVMVAVGEGARTEAVRAIEKLGATNILLRTVKPPQIGSESQSLGALRYGLEVRDLDRIQACLPVLVAVAPTRNHGGDLRHFDRHVSGQILGVTPSYAQLHDLRLSQGRFIETLDRERLQTVAVLGASVARILFPMSNPIGKSIRIDEDRYFQVIGVLQPRGTGDSSAITQSSDFDREVYIPFETDLHRLGENIIFDRSNTQLPEKVEISQVTFSIDDEESVKPAAKLIESVLHSLNKEREAVLTVPLELLERAEQTQRVFTSVLTAIASISLLVGGIGIMNIMLATVTERTREIGIRRALGATRRDIILQFLVESMVLASLGGLIGILFGIFGAMTATFATGVATSIRVWSTFMAFVISVAVGLVFGTFPARRAAMLDPIESLRHD